MTLLEGAAVLFAVTGVAATSPVAPRCFRLRKMSASGGGGGGRQGQKISSESLGGIIQKNSGGLIQGAIFGAVWIWGPNLSWWQWVLVALVGFIVMMYFRQSSMLYPRCPPNMPKTPADNPPTYKSPAEHNIKHEEVYMDTPDGCRIHAWFMPHTGNPKKVPTVIFFHGNAGNIGYRLPLLKDLYHKVSKGMGWIAFELVATELP